MKKYLKFNIIAVIIFLFSAISLSSLGLYCYNTKIIKDSVTKNNGDYVVLLHGLGRSSFSMRKIGVKLSKQGYKVININYPSTEDTIENLVENNLKLELLERCTDKSKKINFVTHSMGGIMVRHLLSNNNIENINKVVMLAPPNHGSYLADKLSKNKFIKIIMGPAMIEMTTQENSLANSIKPIDYPVGVIAGQYDRKVSVEQTRLAEMTDFTIFPKTHTWIMYDTQVISSIINFLSIGKFKMI